jgi:hypothetical protein
MRRDPKPKAQLRTLIEGVYLAVDGSRTEIQDISHTEREAA